MAHHRYVSPPSLDSKNLEVVPGVGMPGICELGMTPKDFKKRIRDFNTFSLGNRWNPWNHRNNGRIGLIPSLGAEFFYDEAGPVYHMTFHVKPFQHPVIERLNVDHPFRGTLQDYDLSFAGGEVSMERVLAVLGSLPVCTDEAEYAKRLQAGESVSWKDNDGYAMLWYNQLGIVFTIQCNAVTQFEIFTPRKVPGHL